MKKIELIRLLDSAADGLDCLESLLPPPTDDKLVAILDAIDGSVVDMLLSLLQTVNPDLTKDELIQDVQSIKRVLLTVKDLANSGGLSEMRVACRSLAKRPIVLTLIARFL